MIRITRVDGHRQEAHLGVEGSVSGEAVHTVEQAALEAGAGNTPVTLDLSQVTFADRAGVAALRGLRAGGVRLVNVTPFIAELLEGERS